MALCKVNADARTSGECVKTNEIATNSDGQVKKIEEKSNSDDLPLSELGLFPQEQHDLNALDTALPNYPLVSIKEGITRLSAILQEAAIYVKLMNNLRDTKSNKARDIEE